MIVLHFATVTMQGFDIFADRGRDCQDISADCKGIDNRKVACSCRSFYTAINVDGDEEGEGIVGA